jgi:hypothetical protein
MCLSFLDNSSGAHKQIVPHIPSRDTLYLCCRPESSGPSAKDVAPPGASRGELFSKFSKKSNLS